MAHAKFVKAARKDYPEAGIKKGESYYWWKFRFGGMHKSKTPPRASQLTQSEFLGSIYGHLETLEDIELEGLTAEDLRSTVEGVAEEIRNLGQEQEDKVSNMPDSLQESETAQLLQNREASCEDLACNLESIDMDVDEDLTEEDKKSRLEEILDEVQSHSYDGE